MRIVHDRPYIRVSELSEFTYCSVAWHLRMSGAPSDPHAAVEQEAGREFHHEHARQLARRNAAATASAWLAVAALLTGALLFLYFIFGR